MEKVAIYGAIALGFGLAHGDSVPEFLVRFVFTMVVAEAIQAALQRVQ